MANQNKPQNKKTTYAKCWRYLKTENFNSSKKTEIYLEFDSDVDFLASYLRMDKAKFWSLLGTFIKKLPVGSHSLVFGITTAGSISVSLVDYDLYAVVKHVYLNESIILRLLTMFSKDERKRPLIDTFLTCVYRNALYLLSKQGINPVLF